MPLQLKDTVWLIVWFQSQYSLCLLGNLKDLYIKYIKPNQKVDTSFFKKMENSAIKETNQKNPNKGTFFK